MKNKIYGTYQIVCKTTGKKYIGSSWAGIEGRWKRHLNLLRNGKHNPKFQNAWNKYGESDFFFGILDVLEKDKNICLKREQEYFDSVPYDMLLNTNFHASGGNGGTHKGKPISPEHRANISAGKKGKPAWNKGKPMSEEQKQKQSAANKGKPSPKKGRPLSEETKAKISATNKAIYAAKTKTGTQE